MDIDVSKMGERGQIVIPQEFRSVLNLKSGEKIIMVREDGKIIMEPVKSISARSMNELSEELADLRVCARFWEDVKKGNVIRQSKEEFLKDLEKW